ncbi:MAG: hypothetical protein AAF547_08445 [Actinomycetota bacterium]
MQEQYGEQVRFIGVPGLSDTARMGQFVAQTGVTGFPHIPDGDGVLWERFGVTEQRTYVFINDDGTARVGGYGQLAEDVEALIAS